VVGAEASRPASAAANSKDIPDTAHLINITGNVLGSQWRAVDLRYAKETDAKPSFRRHVLPLLGRVGCNGRACHGSFQGQGGFWLSLFGYDFDADYKALNQWIAEGAQKN
jgi:hypothetical protein